MKSLLFTFGVQYLMIVQPWGSGVVASATAPNGTRCVVEQRFNGWDTTEFYTVTLYTQEAGGGWQGHYVDHEAARWSKCQMTFSEDSTRLYTIGGDGKRRSFDLGGGTPSGPPRHLPEKFKDQP
jgi:hypothetical protein